MSYQVKLNVFEGPFDLLVYLIEKAEMSIYEIHISEITDQYLTHVEQMDKTDVEVTGEFMVLAAALIEIKSKLLLPQTHVEDFDEPEDDPRAELVEKLLEYKRFKAAAAALERREEAQSRVFIKPQEDLSSYIKEPDELLSLGLDQFVKAFDLFLIRKRRLEEMRKTYARVRRQRMSIEARIEQLKDLIVERKRMRFQELLQGEESRYHIVLTFVSTLELVKQKSVWMEQAVNFGEIIVSLREPAEHQTDGYEMAGEVRTGDRFS